MSDTQRDAQGLLIRPGSPSDVPFIFATWLKGLYYGNPFFREIDQETFFRVYHKVIENALVRPTIQVNIACLKDTPDVVLGYSICEGTRLHWVFTKASWRKIGIAKLLIPHDIDIITHTTKLGLILKPKHWVFNPFLV